LSSKLEKAAKDPLSATKAIPSNFPVSHSASVLKQMRALTK